MKRGGLTHWLTLPSTRRLIAAVVVTLVSFIATIGVVHHGMDGFPPADSPLASLLVPATGLSPAVANTAWLAASSAAVGALLLMCMAISANEVWTGDLASTAVSSMPLLHLLGWLLFFATVLPFHGALLSGHFVVVPALVFAGALFYHVRNAPIPSGLLLGAVLVLKPSLLLFLPFFVVVRPRFTLVWTALGVATITTLFVVFGDISAWYQAELFPPNVATETAATLGQNILHPDNIGIGAAFVRFGLLELAWIVPVGLVVWAVVVGMAGVQAFRRSVSIPMMVVILGLLSVICVPFSTSANIIVVSVGICAIVLRAWYEYKEADLWTAISVIGVINLCPGMPASEFLRIIGLHLDGAMHASVTSLLLLAVVLFLLATQFRLPSLPHETRYVSRRI